MLWEEDLIEFIKPILKSKGFKKKNKRWTKDIGDFTLVFYIQGSCFSKEDYYIRPGIFINALLPSELVYGHFMTQIEITTPEKIISDFDRYRDEWTNKSLIKERCVAFVEWEKRNPIEKRRAKLVDYSANPVPAEEFFMVRDEIKTYIINNY